MEFLLPHNLRCDLLHVTVAITAFVRIVFYFNLELAKHRNLSLGPSCTLPTFLTSLKLQTDFRAKLLSFFIGAD
jgi:hypothetical protein